MGQVQEGLSGLKYPQITFEPTGREERRTGGTAFDADFPQRVVDLVRNQDPWLLWVHLPNGDILVRDVADLEKVRREADHWWSCQGFRPLSMNVPVA